MTPEQLAETEQQARANSEMGCVCLTCDCAALLDLIAHIRDLEAQVREAREALERIAFEDDVVYLGCADMPFCTSTHDEHCPVRIARDALATATPPSPEVGE